jgi:hypothetical protein
MEKKYRVYYLIDPRDGLVKYVGITSQSDNSRYYTHSNLHKTILKYKRNLNKKEAWIKSLANKGLRVVLEIVYYNLSEHEACTIEEELISLFGREDLGEGQLKNGTNGGGGTKGFVATDDFKEKCRKRMLSYVASEETKRKISESKKGKSTWLKGKTGVYSIETLKNMQRNQPQRKVIEVLKGGLVVGKYITIVEACRQLRLERTKVSSVLNGRGKSHRGYTFKIVD